MINFAVIGMGHIGKRHAQMVVNNPEANIVALCDIVPERENAIGDLHSDVPYFTDPEKMLREVPDIDVVCVCSPNGLHAQQASLVLKHGKHVVVEKPLGLTVPECKDLISSSMEASKKVFCVMQNRYSPPSVWLKSVMDQNLLGDIYMIQVNCFWNRGEAYYKKSPWKGTNDLDGGTLFTQFSHFIDIMYWVFGDIKDIKGTFADFNHSDLTDFEDSGIVTFKLMNGALGVLNYSTSVWDSNMESSISVIGSTGSVKVGGQYMNQVEHCHIKDYVMPELEAVGEANDYGHYKGSAANHHFIIENVVDTLKGRAKTGTNAIEGLYVVDIIDRIYKERDKSFKKVK
jgi:UDP-N-acetyl-2-amino-2-deoxyglucuronate dehydrogenase